MSTKNLSELSKDELLQELKKYKTTKIYDAAIIGMLVGIATYSSVKNGFGWLTFLPLIYLPIAAKNKAKNKEIENLLNER